MNINTNVLINQVSLQNIVNSQVTIQDVEAVMKLELPSCWAILEACLSLIAATQLEDLDHCIGLILVGAPGGRKSTTLELLGKEDPISITHKFTPASFVSHSATSKEEELRKIDLLPRIKHKIMVIPELAPVFSQRYEDLVNDIGILTAVMDGKGFQSDSGMHGHRGYLGDYRFGMIAATTPLAHKDWQALGKLSSRWIIFDIGEETENIDLRTDFRAKKEKCKDVVQAFLKQLWKGYASVTWDRSQDCQIYTSALFHSAASIAKWRGQIQRQDAQGYNLPIVETPNRLAETLYALTRGHALLYSRGYISGFDERFIANVNRTNMPEDRLRIYHSLYPYDEFAWEAGEDYGIRLADAMRVLKCSNSKADSVLKELVDLGVLTKEGLMYYRGC